MSEAEEVNGLKVLIKQVEGSGEEVKKLAETVKDRLTDGLVLLYSVNNDKAVFVSAASKTAISRGLTASTLVKTAAVACGGNGGGRPDVASAGGKDITKLSEALKAVRNLIES